VLSIGAMASGQERYYLDLAREDCPRRESNIEPTFAARWLSLAAKSSPEHCRSSESEQGNDDDDAGPHDDAPGRWPTERLEVSSTQSRAMLTLAAGG